MLEWIKKVGAGPDDPMRSPSAASALLANLRGADPVTALNDLSGWLESLKHAEDFDDRVRSEVLGLIQEAGAAHVSVLLGNYLGDLAERPVLRELKWKALFDYASSLTQVLCVCAGGLTAAAKEDASSLSASAASAVRGLRACRTLDKVCLVHYLSAPSSLWRLAYSVHAGAEAIGCATTAVHPHPSHKTATTVTQELLRLLMLQVSAPEMMAPEQIEVADRVTQQLGSDFTLRPTGVTDNVFCFDPESDLPPQRAIGPHPGQGAAMRYFGPGAGLDALARLHKQLGLANAAEVKAFGKDISSHAQVAAVEHLLLFWGPKPAYTPPAHSPASADLLIAHGYARICRHLSNVESAKGGSAALGIAAAEDAKPQTPEEWALRDAGGSELGAEIPQLSGSWARCGELLGVSVRGSNVWWLGVIRRMHAELGKSMHVDIAVFSRKPLVMSLRALGKGDEEGAAWETLTGGFASNYVTAILLPDVSKAVGKLFLLLPPEGWKAGRVYEAIVGEPSRYLRISQLLKRGDDYVRAAFEWMSKPER
jgi:hypothetical protein